MIDYPITYPYVLLKWDKRFLVAEQTKKLYILQEPIENYLAQE